MEDSKHPDFIKAFYLKRGFSTRALHAGEHFGQPHTPAHVNPIYQTSTFVFSSAEEGQRPLQVRMTPTFTLGLEIRLLRSQRPS